MKLLIIGGVAGGMVAATRARRINENAEIIVFERGPDISYGNCGMPYYIGGVITDRSKLLIATAEYMRTRYNLDVRIQSRVEKIDREAKKVIVRDLQADRLYEENYDKLIFSPGADPIKPSIPGINVPGIFTLRHLQDMDRIKAFIIDHGVKNAVVVGAGFIGLEMVENLALLGIQVNVVELQDQVLPILDKEMVQPIRGELSKHGVGLYLSNAVEAFLECTDGIEVKLREGSPLKTQLVILSIGVRPENQLAVDAGLAIGTRGGIKVNPSMQTSDPDIYAVGDAVESKDFVTGEPVVVPLAGPAVHQARIATDNIFGRHETYRGPQGSAIVQIFDLIAALTGASEKTLLRIKKPYLKVYVHPTQHVRYYPGANQMSIKVLFEPESGKLLGAQIIGGEGVDKRIDLFALAIQAGMTVFDLEEAELAYSPQFGGAKDPINFAGFVASNLLRGDQAIVSIEGLDSEALLIDVRSPEEYAMGYIPGAINIPIDELRQRLNELPREHKIQAYCAVGMRGYLAARILSQAGYHVENISGGYTTYKMYRNA